MSLSLATFGFLLRQPHVAPPRPLLGGRASSAAMGLGPMAVQRATELLASSGPSWSASVAQQTQLFAMQRQLVASASSAPLWQLLGAFLLGGALSSVVITADGLRKTFGPKNVQRGKELLLLVIQRTWRVVATMLGAASMALIRKQLPGAPCSPELLAMRPELCEVPRSRWEESRDILRAGFKEARRAAREGLEAIKLEYGRRSQVPPP